MESSTLLPQLSVLGPWQEYSGMLRSKVLLNFAHSGMDPSMDNRLLHSMEGGLIC